MGSERVKTAPSRSSFGTPWLVASTVPVLLGYATGDRSVWVVMSPYLPVVGIALGILQGLVLERSFGGRIFWKWLAVTVPLVMAAPFAGFAVGVLLVYAFVAADALVQLMTHTRGSLSALGYLVALGVGLAGGGAPVVLAQWVVLRKHLGRRWLWTLPVPGLTYGLAYAFSRDSGAQPGPMDAAGLAVGVFLALIYAVFTAGVIVTTPASATAAVEH